MSRYSKSDYINREMAADSIVIECDGVTLEQARQALKDCPSADVVEVVRCKDCKYWHDDGIMTTCDKNIGNGYDAEYYCADGERGKKEHE